jgi:hypothetical protein
MPGRERPQPGSVVTGWLAGSGALFLVAAHAWLRELGVVGGGTWLLTGLFLVFLGLTMWQLLRNSAGAMVASGGASPVSREPGSSSQPGESAESPARSDLTFLRHSLRKESFLLLDDVPVEGGLLDMVILSPNGLFCVHVDDRRKPFDEAKVIVTPETIQVMPNLPSDEPVRNLKALAASLKKSVQEMTGTRFPVLPVILFPHWRVEGAESRSDVWVIHPRYLRQSILEQKKVLDQNKILMIRSALVSYAQRQQEAAPSLDP